MKLEFNSYLWANTQFEFACSLAFSWSLSRLYKPNSVRPCSQFFADIRRRCCQLCCQMYSTTRRGKKETHGTLSVVSRVYVRNSGGPHTGCETGCFLLFASVHSVLKLPHFDRFLSSFSAKYRRRCYMGCYIFSIRSGLPHALFRRMNHPSVHAPRPISAVH
jgi:hypothetical protein